MTACPGCGFANAERVKFCAECGQKLDHPSAAGGEVRRTVSVLFADVTGSTTLGEQLDPEALRALMGRYFATIKAIVERHGGTVEKFIGDAVMAVFGLPARHEDDALRAVRAAAEMRDTLAALNVELQASRGLAIVFRTGVNTGEVVAGDPTGQTLVTGDTVNTAARLEQAAAPGEILLGAATYRLVRDAVVAEPSEPLAAKGKAQPLTAYRLVSVTEGAAGHARRLDTPMVGRARELQVLTEAFERCAAERTAVLVTVLGEAGVGKSRLIHELRQQLGPRATVLLGRCLSYGEGLTYWPLAEALRAPAAANDDDPLASWRAGLTALAGDQPQAEIVVDRILGLLGLGPAGGSGEAFWAVRRLLGGMAQARPLVLVIDDLHWATPTFLDLLEHLAGWTRDAPLLLVAVARPELLEARPGWGSGEMRASTVRLHPLDAGSIDQLLGHLLGRPALESGLPRRIAAAAEGNPLFVEELVAMLAERGELPTAGSGRPRAATGAELDIPPTIEALLAARLDQLPGEERTVLGRGSVIGRQFGAGEVTHLSDEPAAAPVHAALLAMVRRDLLQPDPEATLPMGADDEGFAFRHQLIRDATYAGLAKAERARLHERYAGWLEELPADRLRQLDEVVGYHLEQAHRLWAELEGAPGQSDTAARAATHLGAAGRRALERLDYPAAANLLARAAALLPAADPQRIGLLPRLAQALLRLGRFEECQAALGEVIEATADGSNPGARVKALCVRSELAGSQGATVAERTADIDEALAIAESTADPAQFATVHLARMVLAWHTGRLAEARRECELATTAAAQAGDPALEAHARGELAGVVFGGTSSGAEVDRAFVETLALARERGNLLLEALVRRNYAVEAARRGRLPEARELAAESRARIADLGTPFFIAGSASSWGQIEALAGEPAGRERVLREGYRQLAAMGERSVLSSIAADLADALVDLGRLDEADAICAVAAEAGAEDDVDTQVGVRLVRGRIAAARGHLDDALASVATGLALADQTEYYDLLTDARLVFAQLLVEAGRFDEARARAREVVDLARVRGDVVTEGRANALIERTQASSPAAS
jgi:class 3 adenylate cyclase/tetratricopeptide (TPR) repeat protein